MELELKQIELFNQWKSLQHSIDLSGVIQNNLEYISHKDICDMKNNFNNEFSIQLDSLLNLYKETNEFLTIMIKRKAPIDNKKVYYGASKLLITLIIELITKEMALDPESDILEKMVEICEEHQVDIEEIEETIINTPLFREKLQKHLVKNNICRELAPKVSKIDRYT